MIRKKFWDWIEDDILCGFVVVVVVVEKYTELESFSVRKVSNISLAKVSHKFYNSSVFCVEQTSIVMHNHISNTLPMTLLFLPWTIVVSLTKKEPSYNTTYQPVIVYMYVLWVSDYVLRMIVKLFGPITGRVSLFEILKKKRNYDKILINHLCTHVRM